MYLRVLYTASQILADGDGKLELHAADHVRINCDGSERDYLTRVSEISWPAPGEAISIISADGGTFAGYFGEQDGSYTVIELGLEGVRSP
jgi:hypothetical protein